MKNPSTLLVVDDLKVALQFYTNILSFELIERHADCVKLKVGQHCVYVFQGTKESIPYSHGENANSTLLLTVDNLDISIEKLKSHGVTFVHDTPNENRFGRYTAFQDPFGIVFELFELNS